MTVAEYVEQLLKLDQTATVVNYDYEWGYSYGVAPVAINSVMIQQGRFTDDDVIDVIVNNVVLV
jgi:hypothetical protein